MKTLTHLILAAFLACASACVSPRPPAPEPACPDAHVRTRPLSAKFDEAKALLQIRKFGWLGDDGSKPVRMFSARGLTIKEPLPQSNLRPKAADPYDQENIGSCVGNGVAMAYAMAHFDGSGSHEFLSRLMIYYEARKRINSVNYDSGCQIVDAVQSMEQEGACPESMWPYVTSRFRDKPCPDAYKEALKHRAVRAYKVDNTDGESIRLALSNGKPVIIGSLVYNGIMRVDKQNPVIPMPRRGERPIGGHCTLLIGHDDSTRLYLVQNSWGPDWGDGGRGYFPYDYIHDGRLTEDCWVIDEVMLPSDPFRQSRRSRGLLPQLASIFSFAH